MTMFSWSLPKNLHSDLSPSWITIDHVCTRFWNSYICSWVFHGVTVVGDTGELVLPVEDAGCAIMVDDARADCNTAGCGALCNLVVCGTLGSQRLWKNVDNGFKGCVERNCWVVIFPVVWWRIPVGSGWVPGGGSSGSFPI